MTTEANGSAHDAGSNSAAALPAPLLQALIEALNDDGGRSLADMLASGGGTTLIKTLLAQSQLSAEQQSVVDLLGALDRGGKHSDDEDVVDVEPVVERIAVAPAAPAARQADWRELRDLRQLNDTLAAALGACRVCWGGDNGCDVCGGRGRAGFARPDLDLFDELVAPALRRVVAMRRAGRSDPFRNRR